MAPVPGLVASESLMVDPSDTANEIGTGAVAVLATAQLLALCERAAVAAVATHLEDGLTTVGVQVRLDHVTPTPTGCKVTAAATLEKVAGKKLYFTISAHDERGLVAAGKITRVIVNERDFMTKCRAEAGQPMPSEPG